MVGVDSLLAGLEDKLTGQDDERSKMMLQAMNMLFSSEPDKIIQTTRLKEKDIQWATAVEMLFHFTVKDFCDYDNHMNIQSAINRLYQMRVSIDMGEGNGRTELFKAIQGESRILGLLDGYEGEKRKA